MAYLLSFFLALECWATEVRWGLDPGILMAVVSHESSGRQRLITQERGGCSAGAAQVYVPGCTRKQVMRLLDLRTNLDAGAKVLSRSRDKCKRNPKLKACRRCVWAFYNAGSGSWCRNVERKWKELLPEWPGGDV